MSNAEKQARWRARHPAAAAEHNRAKSRRRLMFGLVRQALRNEHFALPAELAAMVVRWPTEEEIAAGRARNLAKARARVDRRRERYGGAA